MRLSKNVVQVLFAGIVMMATTCIDAQEGMPCDAEPTNMSINFGEVTTCAIDLVGDSDLFTFEANVGDVVIIQLAETAGNALASPCIEVFFGGSPVDSACDFNNPRLDLTLSGTGVHTIVVTDDNDDTTFDYTLGLERIVPLSCSTVPICFGCLLQKSIDPIGDIDVVAFRGVSGDLITVTMAETAGNALASPCIEVFFGGSPVDSACDFNNPRLDLTLSGTGIYNLVMSDDNDDALLTYNITVQCIGSCQEFVLDCLNVIFADSFEN
jgi:hypothetical protein